MEAVRAAPGSTIAGRAIEAVEQRAEGVFFIVQIDRQGGEAVTNRRVASGPPVLDIYSLII